MTKDEAIATLRAALKKAEHAIKGREHTGFIDKALADTAATTAPSSEPVAYMRRWAFDGEKPAKERNANGRMAWPHKFKLHAVTRAKVMSDDVALYAEAPAAPVVAPEWISVADRLPKIGVQVLVFTPDRRFGDTIVFDTWDEQHEDPIGMGGPTICTGVQWNDHESEEISHWMPLPAAPAAPLNTQSCTHPFRTGAPEALARGFGRCSTCGENLAPLNTAAPTESQK